ncbi:MAG: pentapeptide repeat-containing protein [Terricaulis sp.]
MTRAALFACLLALCAPALAQPPGETGGPIVSQSERDAIAARVRDGAACAGCDLFQAELAYHDISGRDFSGSRLRQAELSLVTADHARFRAANLSLANMFGGRFSRADFTEANLSHSIGVGGYFGGARFDNARIDGMNFSGAELANATGLTQAQLNTACGDANTTLPAGMTIPRC